MSDHIKRLREEYPEFYTKVVCGVGFGPGWYDLLKELSENLRGLTQATGLVITVQQVKEKFGGLRYYVQYSNKKNTPEWAIDAARALIDRAESRSTQICETCGKWGMVRATGWVRTLCRDHYEEWCKEKNVTPKPDFPEPEYTLSDLFRAMRVYQRDLNDEDKIVRITLCADESGEVGYGESPSECYSFVGHKEAIAWLQNQDRQYDE